MKFKSLVKIAALAGIGLATASLATGCGKKSEADVENGKTLLMYQVGDKPENYDQLMKIANKTIKEKIGYTLDLQYISWGEWNDKMNAIITSGENFDIAFANNYVANAQKGAYADLTELAPKYAKEAYESLDDAYIKGNLIDGKLYAFPVQGNVFSQQVLTFNKSYLDETGKDLSNVKTYADVTPILEAFKEKHPNVAPFAIGSSFYVSGNYDFPLGKEQPFAIKLDGDTATIINQYADDELQDNLRTMRSWYKKGLIPTDAATSTTAYPLEGNTWLMREETQGPMDYGDTTLTNTAAQELVSAKITDASKRTTNAQMANFVVANVSKKKEAAVKFLGLLNSDKELLNGLVWGVEGEAWEKVSDNKIKILDGYKPNTHMAPWNTGNNMILYTQDTITDAQIAERDESIKNAESSPMLGFNFKTDKVKTQVSNVANVMNRYAASLNTGTVDPDETIAKFLKDLKAAGWDKVRDEIQAQYDEFRK
jgi:putative aldouronate transport system substrate-binding protein